MQHIFKWCVLFIVINYHCVYVFGLYLQFVYWILIYS